jgi:hypothetical protein
MNSIQSNTVMNQRLNQVLQLKNSLLHLGPRHATVPETTGIKGSDFFNEFYRENRPLIIRGLGRSWPAIRKWTDEYLEPVRR